jgi:hypothetical protein
MAPSSAFEKLDVSSDLHIMKSDERPGFACDE